MWASLRNIFIRVLRWLLASWTRSVSPRWSQSDHDFIQQEPPRATGLRFTEAASSPALTETCEEQLREEGTRHRRDTHDNEHNRSWHYKLHEWFKAVGVAAVRTDRRCIAAAFGLLLTSNFGLRAHHIIHDIVNWVSTGLHRRKAPTTEADSHEGSCLQLSDFNSAQQFPGVCRGIVLPFCVWCLLSKLELFLETGLTQFILWPCNAETPQWIACRIQ